MSNFKLLHIQLVQAFLQVYNFKWIIMLSVFIYLDWHNCYPFYISGLIRSYSKLGILFERYAAFKRANSTKKARFEERK
jgi:hypothetical protein